MPVEKSFEEIIDIQNKLIKMQYTSWIHNDLFSFQFWLLLFLLIAPWFLWWKLVRRDRLIEILLYGFLANIVVTFIDEFGCQLNLWEYQYDIEPLFPRMIPINYTILPVTFMLAYQYFPGWRQFFLIHTVIAVFFSFGFEPLFYALGIYKLYRWKFIYSFPLYIAVPVLLKWFVSKLLKQTPARGRPE